MVMQKLNGQPEFLKRILEDMQSDTKFTSSLKSWRESSATPTPSANTASSTTPRPPRSLATPEWGTEGPWNFRRKLTSLESLPAVDFEPLNPTLGKNMNQFCFEICGKLAWSCLVNIPLHLKCSNGKILITLVQAGWHGSSCWQARAFRGDHQDQQHLAHQQGRIGLRAFGYGDLWLQHGDICGGAFRPEFTRG